MRAVFFFLLAVFLLAFTNDNPFFRISKQDVELKIPKGFPDLACPHELALGGQTLGIEFEITS